MAIEWVENASCKECGVKLTGYEFAELDSHCIDCHEDSKKEGF